MKYKKIEGKNIDAAFEYYLAKESLYHHFFGHTRGNERRKVNYIWKRLLKQYYPNKSF